MIHYIILFLIVFNLTSDIYAQEELRLLGADLLTNEVINGHVVRKLIGNVAVQQGVVTLYSDQVSYIPDLQEWTFDGHVRIIEPEKEVRSRYIIYNVSENWIHFRDSIAVQRGNAMLTAQRGVYYPDKRQYACAGMVHFNKEQEHVYADSAQYFERSEIIEVFKDVLYVNSLDKIRLTGGYGKFYPNRDYGLISHEPSVVFEDSTTIDSTRILGNVMEHFGKDRRLRVTDSVRIYRGNLSARCDTAWYFRNTNEVRLSGAPSLHQEDKTIVGETIALFFSDNKIEKMIVEGRARATMRVDTSASTGYEDVLEGSTIVIQFVNSEISQMTAKRNARSKYHVLENKEHRGASMVMGESISLQFSESRLSKVQVEGGSEGFFYPPNLVGSMPKEGERSVP